MDIVKFNKSMVMWKSMFVIVVVVFVIKVHLEVIIIVEHVNWVTEV